MLARVVRVSKASVEISGSGSRIRRRNTANAGSPEYSLRRFPHRLLSDRGHARRERGFLGTLRKPNCKKHGTETVSAGVRGLKPDLSLRASWTLRGIRAK